MIDYTKAFSQMSQYPVPGRLDIDPAESFYILPNTVNECSRLNLQHTIMRDYLRTNTVAPIGHPQRIPTTSGSWEGQVLKQVVQLASTASALTPRRILDVGCGTGRWAIEMAREFPNTHVVGIDIVEPARAYAHDTPPPANYSFFRGNILRGLPSFVAGTFDYVHMRFIGAGIPGGRWQAVINELARLTAPNGWIEIVDYTVPVNAGPAMTQALTIFMSALSARGIDLACTRVMHTYLHQAHPQVGAITSRMLELPMGIHGGTIGSRIAWNLIFAISNLREYCLQSGVCKTEEWQTLIQEIESEAKAPDYQPSLPLYITIGQRKG